MSIYIYAINSVLTYCVLTTGVDMAGKFFSHRPFYFNSTFDSWPFFLIVWSVLLFHKPKTNIYEQQDFVALRRRVIELGVMMMFILIPYSLTYLATAEISTDERIPAIYKELSRFSHLSVFFFSLYTATYSQVFANILSKVTIPKAIATFITVWSITITTGLIFFAVWVVILGLWRQGRHTPPVITQNNIFRDKAYDAADKYEREMVKKTCEPMSEETKYKFREEYFEKLQKQSVGPTKDDY